MGRDLTRDSRVSVIVVHLRLLKDMTERYR